MILWPLREYQPLEHAGEWRLSMSWLPFWRFSIRRYRYLQGTVYSILCARILIKVLVKS